MPDRRGCVSTASTLPMTAPYCLYLRSQSAVKAIGRLMALASILMVALRAEGLTEGSLH